MLVDGNVALINTVIHRHNQEEDKAEEQTSHDKSNVDEAEVINYS